MGGDRTGPSSDPLRLTVSEAADALGVTVDAIRGRIRRGTLDSERESGTVHVWVDRSELARREPSSAGRKLSSDQSELIEELRDRIRSLERRLDEEQEARRRTDLILAQLARANEEQAHTIRELEAPPSEQEQPPSFPTSWEDVRVAAETGKRAGESASEQAREQAEEVERRAAEMARAASEDVQPATTSEAPAPPDSPTDAGAEAQEATESP